MLRFEFRSRSNLTRILVIRFRLAQDRFWWNSWVIQPSYPSYPRQPIGSLWVSLAKGSLSFILDVGKSPIAAVPTSLWDSSCSASSDIILMVRFILIKKKNHLILNLDCLQPSMIVSLYKGTIQLYKMSRAVVWGREPV